MWWGVGAVRVIPGMEIHRRDKVVALFTMEGLIVGNVFLCLSIVFLLETMVSNR